MHRVGRGFVGRVFRATVAIGVTVSALGLAGVAGTGVAHAASTNTVLILSTTVADGTVANGMSSVEAQEATADGYAVTIVTPTAWSTMTTAQFASYRAIILGDPTCGNESAISAAEANTSTWGAAVNGNIEVLGTDPVFHDSQGGHAVTVDAVDFATAQSGKTGAYVSLSCYFDRSADLTPVAVLNAFAAGGFSVHSKATCSDAVHIVDPTSPAVYNSTNASLSNWSCSVHEAFQTWPASFGVAAIDTSSGASFVAPDGTRGDPYILTNPGGFTGISMSGAQNVPIGNFANVRATLRDHNNFPLSGVNMNFSVTAGPGVGATGSCKTLNGIFFSPSACTTDADGQVTLVYSNTNGLAGTDTVTVWADTNSNGVHDSGDPSASTTVTWISAVKYVAYGDSYSSGEGVSPYASGTDTSMDHCHRSTRAYSTYVQPPGWPATVQYASSNGIVNGATYASWACSGAIMQNVRPAADGGRSSDEGPQLDEPGVANANLVTITISGNDAGFGDILYTCARHACTSPGYTKQGVPYTQWIDTKITGLLGEIKQTILDVQSKTPNATIFVLGYPQLFPATSDEQYCTKLTPWHGEEDFLRAEDTHLNNVLSSVAASVGVFFVPVDGTFAGHEPCGNGGGEWINGITVHTTWNLFSWTPIPVPYPTFSAGKATFHPTSEGQREYWVALQSFINAQIASGVPLLPDGLPQDPAPQAASALIAATTSPTDTYGDLTVAPVTTPACTSQMSFAPGDAAHITGSGYSPLSTVTVSFSTEQKTPVTLGTLQSNANGNISGTFSVPTSTPTTALGGFEAIGPDPNGASHDSLGSAPVVPGPPCATDDTATTQLSSPVTIPILTNDTPGGAPFDPASVAVSDPPTNGSSVVNSAGSITYTPAPGYLGNDSFQYTACNTGGACTTGKVTVTVTIACTITGTGNDTMTGTAGNDVICDTKGNNKIVGGGGNDIVVVGDGDNHITVGDGNNTVYAGNGNNVINAGNGNNTIFAGNGDNTIGVGAAVGAGTNNVTVGNGNNLIHGGTGTNNVHTGTGVNQVWNYPVAPTGVTATAGTGQVALSWTADPNAAAYNLYRNGTKIASVGAPVTSYTDLGLTDWNNYTYTIRSAQADYESPDSTGVTATPGTIPAAPTGTSPTAADQQVTLFWAAVAHATSYNIYDCSGTGCTLGGTPITTAVTASTYAVTGLTNGTQYSFAVSAVNAFGEGPKSATVSATPIATAQYHTLTGALILDTRTGTTTGTCSPSPCARIPAGHTLTVTLAGHGGIPTSGVAAVVLNVTAFSPSAESRLIVYPSDAAIPNTRDLSLNPGGPISNTVITKLDGTGKVNVLAPTADTDLRFDVEGYFSPAGTAGGTYNPVAAQRVADSRDTSRAGTCVPSPCNNVAAGGTVTVTIAGQGGLPPATDISAVALSITAINTTAAGYVTAYPAGASRPSVRSLSFDIADTASNLVVAKLSSDGKISLFFGSGGGDFMIDVAGYYSATTTNNSAVFVSQVDTRSVDTRAASRTGSCTPSCATLAAGASITIQMTGQANVPSFGVTAVSIDVSAMEPAAAGYLTVSYLGATGLRTVSFASGEDVTTASIVALPPEANGQIVIKASTATDVLVDVNGWYLPAT